MNGNPIAGATSQNYTVIANGNYSVEIFDGNGCSSMSAPFNFTSTGFTTVNASEPSAEIFPNPLGETTTLNLNLPQEMNVTIKIVDVTGREITVIDMQQLASGQHEIQLSRAQFGSAGTYFVNVVCGSTVLTRKVMVY